MRHLLRKETFRRRGPLLTCFHCAKLIETNCWFTSHDGFDKSFHPQCWRNAEDKAAAALLAARKP